MLLVCDRANGEPEVTVAAALATAAAEEVEVTRVATVELVQRSRPVDSVRATVEDARTVAVACSGKKDAVPVRTGNELAIDAISSCPLPITVVYQFFHFCQGGHTPTTPPI